MATLGEALAELLNIGVQCTCCSQEARKQCLDHDDGYGVCDRCLKKYGRHEFCSRPDCTAHDEGKYKVMAWKGFPEPFTYRFYTIREVFAFLRTQKSSYFTQTFRVGFSDRAFWRNHILYLTPTKDEGRWIRKQGEG